MNRHHKYSVRTKVLWQKPLLSKYGSTAATKLYQFPADTQIQVPILPIPRGKRD